MSHFGLIGSRNEVTRLPRQPMLTLHSTAGGKNRPALPAAPGFANENTQPPMGLDRGLHPQTRVKTPDGLAAIGDLTVGAAILDPLGGVAIIRHILTAAAPGRVMRLRAPYFGLDRDLVVGLNQRLTMVSPAAQYLFGAEAVSVPVWALRDDRTAVHHELSVKDVLHDIQLDRPTDLAVGTCAVGTFARQSTAHVLNDQEARCFASEYRVGFFN